MLKGRQTDRRTTDTS